MNAGRCGYCERPFDRPSPQCPNAAHAKPDLAQRIVAAIEDDLSDRRGLSGAWDGIDDDVRDEIRDRWAELVRDELYRSPH